jgi:CRISPR-associated endonuclease/helicase Cas3
LLQIVRLAAFIHDLGKCSEHFQEMVRGARTAPQLMRHEAASMWLAWPGQPLADWLGAATDSALDYRIAVVAAAGHHRKFWERAFSEEGAGTELRLLVDHEDFAATLALGRKMLRLGAPPLLTQPIVVEMTRRRHAKFSFESWEADLDRELPVGSSEVRMLAVAKALVLTADVAGSTLFRNGERSGWISDALGRRATEDDLSGIVRQRLAGQALRPFQREIAESAAPITLARAGCGSGKTVAAYAWAARNHAGRQLWITYPTTGTATEGFRDYLVEAEIDSRLEHGRAEIDVELLDLPDADGPRKFDRLDSIRTWQSEVVSCTVDTVLGLVQNQRKGLYAWPGISHAALVFDEIHAYDDALFGALLRFLDALPGVPALLMTASLPEARTLALRELCLRVHQRALVEIEGPQDLERLERYRLVDDRDPWDAASAMLHDGGKVLWVSNTVGRCLGLADEAASRGLAAAVYHSRFRYRDRVARHRDVIDAFRAPGPALALTTQVAEMSLDLSADLLLTDLAPVPSLIQRLGRLNRRSRPDAPKPVRDALLRPFQGLPYADDDLDSARTWWRALAGRPISQRDLVQAWTTERAEPLRTVVSAWLDGRFSTSVRSLREASPGITVVLSGDADSVRKREVRAVEVAVPMPPPPRAVGDWRAWPSVDYHPVPPADCIDYSERRGAEWRR